MKRQVQRVVRIVLSIGLLVGVYTETGPWTTLTFVLIFGVAEVFTWIIEH